MSNEPEGRGIWRGVFSSIVEHPDFQVLTPEERLVLLVLRIGPITNIAGIFLLYSQVLEAQTGLDTKAVEAALAGLESKPDRKRPWIIRDERVCWIRNSLRHDPTVKRNNENHLKGLRRTVAALPMSSTVVKKFRRYYPEIGLAGPSNGLETPSAGHRGASRSTPSSTPTPTKTPTQERESEGEPQSPPARLEGTSATASSNNGRSDSGNGHHPADRPTPRSTAYDEELARILRQQPELGQDAAERLALRVVFDRKGPT